MIALTACYRHYVRYWLIRKSTVILFDACLVAMTDLWDNRIVRDQASKTFDIYLQRIRKYAATLPATALRPVVSNDGAASSAPRIGTAQNDKSWAGWAISSFTNKIASARGEIQAGVTANTVTMPQSSSRSASTMPSKESSRPPGDAGLASTSSNPAFPLTAPQPVKDESRSSPTPADTNYFDDDGMTDGEIDAWGAMGEDLDDEPPPATEEATVPTATVSTSSFVAYDDSGEPDFAGWLSAQTQSKSKKPLPKGLVKKSTNSTGGSKLGAAGGRPTTTTTTEGKHKSSDHGGNNRPAASKISVAKSKPAALNDMATGNFSSAPKKGGVEEKEKEEEADPWGNDEAGWGDAPTSAPVQPETTGLRPQPAGKKADLKPTDDAPHKKGDSDDDDDDGGWGKAWN